MLPESGFDEKMTTALGAGEGAPDVAFFWNNNWFPEALDLTPYIEADPDFEPGHLLPRLLEHSRRVAGQDRRSAPGRGRQLRHVQQGCLRRSRRCLSHGRLDHRRLHRHRQPVDRSGARSAGAATVRAVPIRAIWINYGAFPYSDDSMTVDGYLNGPESVAAYTWLWDLVNSGATPTPADIEVLGTEGTGPIDLFLAGRLAMATLNQGHMLNAVEAGANFGIVPEPLVPGQRALCQRLVADLIHLEGHRASGRSLGIPQVLGRPGRPGVPDGERQPLPVDPVACLSKYQGCGQGIRSGFLRACWNCTQVAEWRNAHPCDSTVLRAASDVWDLINARPDRARRDPGHAGCRRACCAGSAGRVSAASGRLIRSVRLKLRGGWSMGVGELCCHQPVPDSPMLAVSQICNRPSLRIKCSYWRHPWRLGRCRPGPGGKPSKAISASRPG